MCVTEWSWQAQNRAPMQLPVCTASSCHDKLTFKINYESCEGCCVKRTFWKELFFWVKTWFPKNLQPSNFQLFSGILQRWKKSQNALLFVTFTALSCIVCSCSHFSKKAPQGLFSFNSRCIRQKTEQLIAESCNKVTNELYLWVSSTSSFSRKPVNNGFENCFLLEDLCHSGAYFCTDWIYYNYVDRWSMKSRIRKKKSKHKYKKCIFLNAFSKN